MRRAILKWIARFLFYIRIKDKTNEVRRLERKIHYFKISDVRFVLVRYARLGGGASLLRKATVSANASA